MNIHRLFKIGGEVKSGKLAFMTPPHHQFSQSLKGTAYSRRPYLKAPRLSFVVIFCRMLFPINLGLRRKS